MVELQSGSARRGRTCSSPASARNSTRIFIRQKAQVAATRLEAGNGGAGGPGRCPKSSRRSRRNKSKRSKPANRARSVQFRQGGGRANQRLPATPRPARIPGCERVATKEVSSKAIRYPAKTQLQRRTNLQTPQASGSGGAKRTAIIHAQSARLPILFEEVNKRFLCQQKLLAG